MTIEVWAWPLIGLVGAVAAVCRVTVDGAVARRLGQRFPAGTMCVNLSGALAMGALYGLGAVGTTRLLIATAGLGSYTTFSTLMYETERLLEEGDYQLAALNIGGSMLLGFVAVTLGWWITSSA